MNNLFVNLSIRNKLIFIIFFASAIVTSIGYSFLFLLYTDNLHKNTINTAKSQIVILNQDFVKIALFGDVSLSADAVSKLKAFHEVRNAYVFNQQGNVIFSYTYSPEFAINPPVSVGSFAYFDKDMLHVFNPLEYDKTKYGMVYLRISPEYLKEQLHEYYLIAGFALPILLFASYLLAIWLQGYFTRPLIALTQEMATISKQQNYADQLDTIEQNEIGQLYHSFNELLATIHKEKEKLQQSEKRLAGILEITGSGIISIDEHHNIILFNRQAEIIFGYQSEDMIGKTLNILLPDNVKNIHSKYINQYNRGNTTEQPLAGRRDIIGKRKNGELFPLEAVISKLPHAGKTIFTVSVNDISERQKAEKALKLYQNNLENTVAKRTKELEEKNKELEAFSYSIAHDLRAPLRSITSFAQILSEDCKPKLDSQDQDLLNRIVAACKRMAMMIDDILDLSRVSRSELKLSLVNLSMTVHRISERYKSDTDKVIWKIQENLSSHADPVLIDVALGNLIENAYKYSSNEAKPIIQFGVHEKSPEETTYFVKDNGIGFDMQYANKLFNPFQRLHNSKDFEGTGIGLATVYRVIQRHNGRIWAESTINQGATFYFTLPNINPGKG